MNIDTKKVEVIREPFKKLVKLAARAFYDDITTKGDNLPKTRSDNRGIAVIVLDALTRREWVREEDLAKDLKIHNKQLRRTLRFFEEEKLIMRDHRKETAKGVKLHAAAVAATADGQPHKEGEDKIKLHTHSYCCLDYAQIYDAVRYRIHRMKKKLKDELESRNTVQEYICPNCNKRYNALDAVRLVSMEDEYFHCESCNGELVAESDKFANQDLGDGDDNARRRRQNKLRLMLQNMEVQLKPLMEQIARVKDLPVPDFGTLRTWEIKASAEARANLNDDSSRSAQGMAGTPMPFLGETKVEVDISGVQTKDGDGKSGTKTEPMKQLPPWMIKQGMNLTSEQRGELKHKTDDESSKSIEPSDDKKSDVGKDEKSEAEIREEYLKAYYAAIYERQLDQEAAAKKQQESINAISTPNDSSSTRQVGMKSKREEDDNEWEDGTPAGNASTGRSLNVDLNVEADANASNDEDEDDDDVEWEEG